jgi:hypothetical protein
MNEPIDVAKLQLDRGADIVEANNLGKVGDNLEPALETA